MSQRPRSSTRFPYTTLFRSLTPSASEGIAASHASPRSRSGLVGDSTESVNKGLAWLVEKVEQGGLSHPTPIGFYFAKLWYFEDRKSTRLNSSHQIISYAVFC